MYILKVTLGLLALIIAWGYIFHNKLIFKMNAWMRDNVFSDRVVLFSGRRMAVLLLVLGGLALFSGLEGLLHIQPIKTNIAAQMIEQARHEVQEKRYGQAINRCRELLKTNPNSVEAWEILVTTWWTIGEKELAEQALQALLRIDPEHPLGKMISPKKTKERVEKPR